MPNVLNPEILVIARGSRGMSQTEFGQKLNWTQGKVSKVDHGLLRIDDQVEVQRIAEVLNYPMELFYQTDVAVGFGSCCLYHRKRTATPVRTLNRIHDEINIRRIQLGRLLRSSPLPHEPAFPMLDIDDYESPEQIASFVRATWALPRGPIRNLLDVVERAGGLVVMAELAERIDAVSQRATGLPPLFFLDRNKPADRCRFTLAHEIGHIVMHAVPPPDAEQQADRFASEFLMPADEIRDDLKDLTIPKAAALKLKWRVSMQAIIRRAKDLGVISDGKYQSLCVRISQLGYRKAEPAALQPETPKMLKWLIDLHLVDRKYSIKELCNAMLTVESEFRSVFLDESPALRLFS